MPFWDKNEKTGDTVSHSPSDPFHRDSTEEGILHDNADHLQRRLGNRQIQLIAIGGSIGTALFVSIGGGLARGGPGSLFLAYFIYSCFLGLVNNCIAEMTILYPVSGGFIRLAGHFVDDAFGFMAGWNLFIYGEAHQYPQGGKKSGTIGSRMVDIWHIRAVDYLRSTTLKLTLFTLDSFAPSVLHLVVQPKFPENALLIPFEITALTTVLGYWSDDIPAWSIPIACIFLYG
ncbi:hypothetical protein E4T39_08742 [Aureobasidium subglaciale]|nr:hypothetical protein E4T39_08742 [Aureobasidium subglaciale]